MPRFIRALIVSGFCLACAAAALADTFFLRYDADGTFPEQEGWTRRTKDLNGELDRTVEDGLFRINSMASFGIYDYYVLQDIGLTPVSGEQLRVDWRMRTLQTDPSDGFSDVTLQVANLASQYVTLYLAPGSVSVPAFADDVPTFPLEPGAWHTYSFVTGDMEQFNLFVDGQFAFQSVFHGWSVTPGPNVAWGDVHTGLRSDSEWDHVQVSIVPEPAAGVAGMVGIMVASLTIRKGVPHD